MHTGLTHQTAVLSPTLPVGQVTPLPLPWCHPCLLELSCLKQPSLRPFVSTPALRAPDLSLPGTLRDPPGLRASPGGNIQLARQAGL